MHRPERRAEVRLAILDDNPFVRVGPGDIRPRAALFHRFAEAVVEHGGLDGSRYLVPVADLTVGETPPSLRPIDERRLTVIPTMPFRGIAGYLAASPGIELRNWKVIKRALDDVDLLWIKAPTSNGLLAAIAARQARIPRFTWVAGRVREVVGGQSRRGAARLAASTVAAVYDGLTESLVRTGPSVVLDDTLFTSLTTDTEIEETRRRRILDTQVRPARRDEVIWAGRMVRDKGVDTLIEAVAVMQRSGRDVGLTLIGDGPDRSRLASLAASEGIEDLVTWTGYLGDRSAYLARLRAADIFVLPSHAEGVPKVLVEAMSAGVPVVATGVGGISRVLDGGRRGRLISVADRHELATAVSDLLSDASLRRRMSDAGLAFAAEHTMERQAQRLLAWLRATFPGLPWPNRGPA